MIARYEQFINVVYGTRSFSLENISEVDGQNDASYENAGDGSDPLILGTSIQPSVNPVSYHNLMLVMVDMIMMVEGISSPRGCSYCGAKMYAMLKKGFFWKAYS